MRKALDKITLSKERKEHYRLLGIFLKTHNIEHKKLPIGYSINTASISDDLVEEFLRVCTFVGD